MLRHRSFKSYRWIRAFFVTMGALDVQGSALEWCAVHRKHHVLSDQEGDPHSPHLHGDGWHNNHHAFPRSARHGLKWWQIDVSWLIIRTMERVGLVWNVQRPSDAALARKHL